MLFFDVKSPAEARRLLSRIPPPLDASVLALGDALGRVVAEPIVSPIDLPEFDRSVVDGFAVRAADTFGASAGLPALVRVIGEIAMGRGTDLRLGVGEAARIATGGMLPAGADAVVMVEFTEAAEAEMVEISRPVAPGENLVRRGDDIRAGAMLLPRGHRLRPQDLGALAGVGLTSVRVYDPPRVAVIPTGDEIVPPEARPGPGQVRDINTVALLAAVREARAEAIAWPIVRDEPEELRAAVAEALVATQLVLIAGGSSVGARDWTLEVLLGFPGAELLFHGVAVRPGKPVIAVAIGDRLVLGLPGNPVSALLVFHQFVRDVIDQIGRQSSGEARPTPVEHLSAISCRLAASVASDPGKEDHVRVRLQRTEGGIVATPILGKSSLILPLVQADGLIVIPEGVEGLEAGETVSVFPL